MTNGIDLRPCPQQRNSTAHVGKWEAMSTADWATGHRPAGLENPTEGWAAGTACQNTEHPLIHTDTTIAIKSTAPNGDLALL